MKPSEIYFVTLPADALGIARAAAQLAFPGSSVTLVDRLEAVTRDNADDGARLLVLPGSDLAAVAEATQYTDSAGAPRWAVVAMGGQSGELAETVPPEEWNPRLLARVFRSALLQQDLLCENLRMRGDLKTVARRISHDLRTSIGCIHTSSDLLREIDATSLAIAAGTIRESSQEISELIDRVSFVLRASADPTPAAPVAMGEVVASVLRQLRGELEAADAIVGQPPAWPEVSGVGPWLRVIWQNLLSNAIRHGGAPARIQLSWHREAEGYRFAVSDRGPGVKPARIESLFPSFDQLHLNRNTGLGLSITQRLVALQHGRCHYEATSGGGATFAFTLPDRESAD